MVSECREIEVYRPGRMNKRAGRNKKNLPLIQSNCEQPKQPVLHHTDMVISRKRVETNTKKAKITSLTESDRHGSTNEKYSKRSVTTSIVPKLTDMVFGVGTGELVVIGVIAALVFGPSKLPEMGAAFGKTLRSFQEGIKEGLPEEWKDKQGPGGPGSHI
eukprot:g82902.t1